ncbi:alpha/beta hydrolase [Endozoicomonas arenosclerae]|uniref:alpha/beta hydrolase n=1 Tax=Endozoicomonas arenosclerae TaxID=1633495 RepID=UPI0009A1E267|nr:alpha/beta hydrolase [Endozoicomonas arenosclerae]
MKTYTLKSDDHTIPLYCWNDLPEGVARKGILHISHGMAEYGERYANVAQALNQAGYIVFAHDHRGHGACIEQDGEGYFAGQRGWYKVVDDLVIVVDFVQKKFPSSPLLLMGHSMGSYILQSYLIHHSPKLSGVILSGSNYAPKLLLEAALLIAKMECLRQGKKGISPIIKQLTFTSYNRQFKPNRTEFDWLSRNEKAVDDYIADDLCGFSCSNQLWHDLFKGLLHINAINNLKRIQQDLPILVMGGEKDPVSAPHGQQKLTKALRKAGLKDVTLSLYPEGRHEMLNETNSQQVINRLLQWMNQTAMSRECCSENHTTHVVTES